MRAAVDTAGPPKTDSQSIRVGYLFGAYALLYAAAAYLTNEFILTDRLLEREWNASFDADRVALMIDQRRAWILFGYGLIPAALLLKMLFTGFCISTGCAVMDWPFRFRDLFRAAVHAEFVFAVAALIHLGWGLFGDAFVSLSDYAGFYPLSALHLVKIDASQLWMAYPLKTLNVFEAAYIGTLALALKDSLRRTPLRVLALVACSYGTGLLLLISVVTFLSLYLL